VASPAGSIRRRPADPAVLARQQACSPYSPFLWLATPGIGLCISKHRRSAGVYALSWALALGRWHHPETGQHQGWAGTSSSERGAATGSVQLMQCSCVQFPLVLAITPAPAPASGLSPRSQEQGCGPRRALGLSPLAFLVSSQIAVRGSRSSRSRGSFAVRGSRFAAFGGPPPPIRDCLTYIGSPNGPIQRPNPVRYVQYGCYEATARPETRNTKIGPCATRARPRLKAEGYGLKP
jgi:hypothetical protein